jgi:hypothetical protein
VYSSVYSNVFVCGSNLCDRRLLSEIVEIVKRLGAARLSFGAWLRLVDMRFVRVT